ncbi:MAG: UDPGP type 1 family protein [Planctomycetota bacterium]|jgi:UDP-N-acetylglucosamine/UDP-N-acetylgalactosamine diphosphorylase|nr:UDPGP type 1 family protein [Planctomycetota bacterium]
MADYETMRRTFEANGQGHVFAHWNALAGDERDQLLADCASVDFAWIRARRSEFSSGGSSVDLSSLEPAPVVELPRNHDEGKRNREAIAVGEDILRAGKAAAFLVAGGQGTRLGFPGPKGCYPLGPVSGKTLFQWHAEQIKARSKRYGRTIPWYIMTSLENDPATKAYFEENDWLGLDRDSVFFFMQGMVPSLDFGGKLMLASPPRLAMNPNGHGGSLSGLLSSGAIADMRSRGVEYISYFQVDNPLVTIADPGFLGWHVRGGAEMSSKVLEKNAPDEKIGIVCRLGGRDAVVEYSDLDAETMNARDRSGRLKFWAGSIAIHVINVDFVERVGGGALLPWHQARKKVQYHDGEKIVRPEKENAVKFETFVFDAIPFAGKSVNLEVKREHEFAPVKNAVGVDSVASSRQLLSNYFGEWLAAAGIDVPGRAGRYGETIAIEISPLFSLDQAELAAKVRPGGFLPGRAALLG